MRPPIALARATRVPRPALRLRPSSIIVPVTAPVGGWNARDAIDEMNPKDALLLDNFFPEEGKVALRAGYSSHATGVGSGDVEFLGEFHSKTIRKLLAAGGGAIYDATSIGTASSLKSGFSSNRWQNVNFNGKMGLVNGSDAPQDYDGTTVANMTISGSSLTVANLIGVNVFKSRTYFWEKDSQDFWYSAVNALGGTLTKFPLSRVGQFGGNLTAMGTWTLDSGSGVDDLAVFVMSSGEIIIYAGSNPGDSSDWALVGVFRVGAPLSARGIVKVGGDLAVITRQGYLPLSKALPLGGLAQRAAISDKIQPAVVKATTDFAANYGWHALLYPRGNMLIFNVPVASNTFHQHVMNTATKAWCRFKGMNGIVWVVFDDRLYYGGSGDGTVYLADDGQDDAGENIEGDARQAYSYLGRPSVRKRITAMRPVIAGSGDISISIKAETDFRQTYQAFGVYTITPAKWEDVSVNWEDWTDIWDEPAIARTWLSTSGIGYNVAARIKVQTKEIVQWLSTLYMYQPTSGI